MRPRLLPGAAEKSNASSTATLRQVSASLVVERAMRKALEHAGVSANAIDYVNTHGTSTPLGDVSEVRALRAVFGVTPLGAWMGGDGGMLLYWNGTSASAAPSPISDTIYGIWGSAANNLWAVADRGRVLHFDGSAWSIDAQASALSTTALRAIAGSSDTQIYAVGDGGVMLRFDGTSWSALDTGTDRSLSALWIDAAGTVVVAGQMGSDQQQKYLPSLMMLSVGHF